MSVRKTRASRLAAGMTAAWLATLPAARLARADNVDFSRDVLPILSTRCFECHGPDANSREADLRLDDRDRALAEGSVAPAIVPGDPEASELFVRISSDDPDVRMPPADHGEPLAATEVQLIRQWIAAGAEYTEHWAFVPPVRAAAPEVANAEWVRSPLDRYVLARLDQEGLRPAPEATRETLIRRATLDLTGLPPTPADVAAFVADEAPDAYERFVDRLLASPHYGERWGRHWLDVARYADSGGFETDIFFGHAWRYRDYVIRSFNDDKRFDQFVKEQIAGDELAPDDAAARIATGFYAIGPVLQEAGMVDGQLEYDLLTDAADATGAAFLGLTLGCARCHDHKYDPISQRDYYGLQAIFAGSEQNDFDESGRLLRRDVALRKTLAEFQFEQSRARARALPPGSERDDALREIGEYFVEQDDDLQEQIELAENFAAYERALRRYQRALEQREANADGVDAAEFDAEDLEELLRDVGQQAFDVAGGDREARRRLRRLDRAERNAFLAEFGRERLDLAPPEGLISDPDAFRLEIGRRELDGPSVIPVRALAHRDSPYEVRLLGRGELSAPGERAAAAFPAKLARGLSLDSTPPDKWRSALAEWIASPDNPLTARVIANRVWQGHFGAGLVRTPNDFGIRGERPTHPGLLDWLAIELVEHGWSLKHLHRTIMLSSAYRMSSTAGAATLARDPNNRLLARYQPHRMEAEAIWDGVRAAAGSLNLAMYGLPAAPPLDEQEEIGNYKDWPTSTPEESNRRGVYLLTRRSFRFPALSSFDLPDNATSCGRRDVTTVPNQCLALLNNRTIGEQAAIFADRLLQEANGDAAQATELAWRYAYGREPDDDERAHAREFLARRTQELAADAGASEPVGEPTKEDAATREALRELCLAIFNTNEFIFIP